MPSFQLWSSAWLFLLIPPLVLFYFLKLKRPRLEIPSLILWRQVLSDNRVNSPFQRFKRNILLLLQLLLLLLLILAAMQPFLPGDTERGKFLPILIDNSASMATLDEKSGTSRLSQAKRRVRKIIDGVGRERKLCLISFDWTARKLTGFTNNKRVLHEALDGIRISETGSDIEDVLRLTAALARTASFKSVLLYSDGNFPQQSDVEKSFEVEYQRLDPAGPNMGITAFNARRAGPGLWRVFANLESSGKEQSLSAELVLIQDEVPGEPLRLTVSSGRPDPVVYTVAADRPTDLELRLRPDGFDSLASDNVSFLHLQPARSLRIFVPPQMLSYRTALEVLKGVDVLPGRGANETLQSDFDVVVSNDEADLSRPALVYLFVGVVPADLADLVSVDPTGRSSVVDWRRTLMLLEHVELADLLILSNPALRTDAREEDLELLDYEVMAHGREGPLLLQKREEDKIFFYLLFDTDRSTLPYRIGFPILLSNLVRIGMHHAGLSEVKAERTGVLPALSMISDQTYVVDSPRGSDRSFTTDSHGRLSGVPAPFVGRYDVRRGPEVIASIGVGLLDSDETRLGSVEEILFNELSVSASVDQVKVDRSFWPLLAMLALTVCTLEWWFYQKRPGGVRR